MEYLSIKIEDKDIINKYLKTANAGICEHCFTDIYMWQSHYNTKFLVDDDFLYVKSQPEDIEYHMCPIGNGDLKQAILKIIEQATPEKFVMMSITQQLREKIEQIMPDYFEFTESRDSADYIYLADSLKTLAGKKLHSKRNFVNRFMAQYDGMWTYEKLCDENKDDVWQFHKKWHKNAGGTQEELSLKAETCAIKKAIDNYKQLDIIGGVLKISGEIVAFTLGTKSTDDMYVVQIEKGNIEFAGVYPVINKLFVENECQDAVYINREEDLGIEGLRKAKLSYKPFEVKVKYIAKIK